MHALLAHRVAHALHDAGVPVAPRAIAATARTVTGIEIHPAADVGDGLFIDHGMGVVVGETAEIGENVTLYQGVTLGGTGFATGKRHPTVEDNVTIGSGAKLLGPIRIGHGAKIGANAVVVHDVPPNSTVVGNPGHTVRIEGRKPEGPDADWVHLPDPIADALKALSKRIARARARARRGPRRAGQPARRRAAAAARARAEPRRRVAPAGVPVRLTLLIALLAALARGARRARPGRPDRAGGDRAAERHRLRPPRREARPDAGRGRRAARRASPSATPARCTSPCCRSARPRRRAARSTPRCTELVQRASGAAAPT